MFSADSSKETVRYSHGKRLLFHFGVFVEQQITPQYLIIKVIVWQRFNFSVLWERCAWQFSLRSGVLFRANVRPIIKNVWSHVSDSESGSSIFASRLFLLNDFFMLSGLFWPNWEQFLANCKKKKKMTASLHPISSINVFYHDKKYTLCIVNQTRRFLKTSWNTHLNIAFLLQLFR